MDIDALYGGDLAGFTARRNELAKRLAKDGDGNGAKAVRALRKPSKVAWAVNQISHGRPELRDRLLEAGAALRDSQGARAESQTERDVVGELVAAAQQLAGKADTPLSQVAVDRVRQTLHSVALDDHVRRQFERGALTEEHEAVGLGPVPVSGAPARKRSREALKKAEAEERDLRRKLGDAERELDQAKREADQAQRALKAASDALEKAQREAAAGAERAAELQEQP